MSWVLAHIATLSILAGAVPFIWSVAQFVILRRRESKERQFEAYHRLVKELVTPDSESGNMWIDRQAVVIFELRHFPRYYEFTERMLREFRKICEADTTYRGRRLIEEVDLTLNHLRRKTRTRRPEAHASLVETTPQQSSHQRRAERAPHQRA
jgi:hypothetical protein